MFCAKKIYNENKIRKNKIKTIKAIIIAIKSPNKAISICIEHSDVMVASQAIITRLKTLVLDNYRDNTGQ